MLNKLTTYLAGFIEASPEGAIDWRAEISEKLQSKDLMVYCPVKFEAKKTGKPAGVHVKYVCGLKQAGHWGIFIEEMKKIWFGIVRPGRNRFEVIKQFQYRKLIDGNKPSDLCVDENTKILTKNGIKDYSELKIGELVATFDLKTNEIKYLPLLKVYTCKPGSILEFKTKKRELLFTPNHNIICTKDNRNYIRKAKTRVNWNSRFTIPHLSGIEDGRETQDDNLVKIAAWFLAEGTECQCYKDCKRRCKQFGSIACSISQSKKSKFNKDITDILTALNWDYTRSLSKAGCYTYLLTKGSRDKLLNVVRKNRIPLWIKSTTQRQKRLFIQEYVKADGYNHKKAWYIVVSLKDTRYARELEQLIVESGYRTLTSPHKSPFSDIPLIKIYLAENNRNRSLKFVGEKKYSGIAWCPTTPNNTWIAYKDGMFFPTGNSVWGDFEAVSRSDFIIVNYKHDIPTWGTPAEAVTAFFLDIPIYVISDVPKTKMNSSLLWWVLATKGDVFYSLNDCVKYIKTEYQLSGEEKTVNGGNNSAI